VSLQQTREQARRVEQQAEGQQQLAPQSQLNHYQSLCPCQPPKKHLPQRLKQGSPGEQRHLYSGEQEQSFGDEETDESEHPGQALGRVQGARHNGGLSTSITQ
jgi:hypothetical protein